MSRTQESSHSPEREQAAERRRVKQRSTQRAYRTRRENDISSLRKRVDEMEDAIEDTGKIILALTDTLLNSSILQQYPQVTPALFGAVNSCLSLAKLSHPHSTIGDISLEKNADDQNRPVLPEPPQEHLWWTGIFSNLLTKKNEDALTTALTTQNSQPVVFNGLSSSSLSQAVPATNTTDFNADNIIYKSSNSPTNPLSLTTTFLVPPFPHKEQSRFSQILVQTCFRNGYQLLTDPFTEPTRINSVFGSQFTNNDRGTMAGYLWHGLLNEEEDTIQRLRGQIPTSFQNGSQQDVAYDSVTSNAELVSAGGVQELLWKTGISIRNDASFLEVESLSSMVNFDMKSFVTFLCSAPVCSGLEPMFPSHRVETALRLASIR
ncbi:hypothetical protein BP6252_05927 [Coleophoma cylindrospora]|uniref:BZIP domain-containing protein n=1 Tax=Coleophoma cylindrospora TaxID=1849047 RepID=A0A3D8RL64_9HELO|nr:hypothetical protein BP6252_05927 [Coleophoma cylindrospora]